MFIYLEGKYNSSKGNTIILGTIIVMDAHLKNVNCVNNVREKNTLSQQLEAKLKHLTQHGRSLSLYT